jgi:hypothetical protein
VTKAGNRYYQPTPLDFQMLEAMPPKGILGGVHWAGRPARHLQEDINDALPDGVKPLGTSTIQARLRSMKVAGYVEDFQAHGGGRIWARTTEGSAFLARREQVLGS